MTVGFYCQILCEVEGIKMSTQESKKSVPIYFYYLTISKQKGSKDESIYDISKVIDSLSNMFTYVIGKDLTERKKDNKASEKVIWLDSVKDLKDGNYDLIFKSEKYNHVRNEIDTETMKELGTRKRQQDGDEEKTHLCIRHSGNEMRFLTVHESNHYGITLNGIVEYLNEQFIKYNEDCKDEFHYIISYDIMPGEDFLSSIKKARTMSALKLIVSKDDIKDDFMGFAGRTDIDDEVEICIKRPKGAKKYPDNLIQAYFRENQKKQNSKIKRITIKGTNEAGKFEIDTDLMKMKHYLSVKGLTITNEVDSYDFFLRAQEFIDEMRNKQ